MNPTPLTGKQLTQYAEDGFLALRISSRLIPCATLRQRAERGGPFDPRERSIFSTPEQTRTRQYVWHQAQDRSLFEAMPPSRCDLKSTQRAVD